MSVEQARSGDKDRFILLEAGQARPGRIPVPPAFSVKANSHDTGGSFSLLEVTLAREIPRHVHHKADEFIYVLEGELAVDFDGESHTATAGMSVLLPYGVPHALGPGAGRPPRVLQISSPGGWEYYIEDLIEAGPAVTTNGRFDPGKINQIAARYGITYEE
ncbi:MAG TPA: cupin domain-containing protein [Kribbella sp.]|jgi:quercetin dioxygenase-like cupin family protein